MVAETCNHLFRQMIALHSNVFCTEMTCNRSDYLQSLENLAESHKNSKQDSVTSTAMILVDPLPDSIISLAKRTSEYAMINSGK